MPALSQSKKIKLRLNLKVHLCFTVIALGTRGLKTAAQHCFILIPFIREKKVSLCLFNKIQTERQCYMEQRANNYSGKSIEVLDSDLLSVNIWLEKKGFGILMSEI